MKDLTIEDLRIMIGQNIGLKYLVPMAVEKLKQKPLAEGHFFPGDLLVNVLKADPSFWSEFPGLKSHIVKITEEAFEAPGIGKISFESIQEAYNLFLRASAPSR